MGRRSEHSREELQQLIVHSTTDLIIKHGADQVTARQIAKAVGYTPGMLYSVFENQHDIFLHVNLQTLNCLYEECAQASKRRRTPEKAVLALGLAYLKFAENRTHQFDLLFTRTRSTPSKEQRDQLRTLISDLFALIETELATLNPKRSANHVRVGARALWSGVHGTAQLGLAGQFYLKTKHPDRDIVETLVREFLRSWKLNP